MIEAAGLTKYYGTIPAIQDVSFRVEQGEIMGFLGLNAAGKTTTMRILTGFMPATRGSAHIAGFDVLAHPIEVKRRVGYLPETVPLYPEMVTEKFLRYVAEVKGVPRGEISREVGRVIERSALGSVRGRVIRALSKGFRQRLGIAQALLGSPPVLILDEPTLGLDPQQVVEIRNLIKELAGNHTILLSSHILPEVAMVCHRVIIIHRGRIIAQDTMENLGGRGGPLLLELEVVGAKERVYEVLNRVERVLEVLQDRPDHYLVSVAEGADPREAMVRALTETGLNPCSLTVRRRTLEDMFLEVIASEEGGRS